MALDVHQWAVAGGVLAVGDTVLMVNNRRRNGTTDWSTPGGVVDPGETMLGALTREVAEETGLQVSEWDGPLYTVEADGRDGPGWILRVEVHAACVWNGDLVFSDPDGIVFDARWVPRSELPELLEGQYAWMSEPLLAYFTGDTPRGHEFRYTVTGDHRSGLTVTAK